LPDATPITPPEKLSGKESRKASYKKDNPARVQRPQAAEKKLPISDTSEAAKPRGAEPQSVPSHPTPSGLHTLWPEAPPAGTFSREIDDPARTCTCDDAVGGPPRLQARPNYAPGRHLPAEPRIFNLNIEQAIQVRVHRARNGVAGRPPLAC
jgi:hypothetical protein